MDIDLHQFATPYVIVNGLATSLYMPQRVTLDLDILIAVNDEPQITAELSSLRARQIDPRSIGRILGLTAEGTDLKVIALDEPWVSTAIQRPSRSPDGLPVIALPFLVLMKLAASRAQDLADLSRMLGQADAATRDQVRAAVTTFRPDDLDDLDSLIALGDLELNQES